MKTHPWAIVLIVLTTCFTSVAQVFYKLAVDELTFDVLGIITNGWLIGGLALYACGAVLMILALRGGELSVLYPIIALSYVWVGLLSWIVFGEPMNLLKWLGIFTIVVGVSCIGIASKEPAVTL